jgi:hypothetical protein
MQHPLGKLTELCLGHHDPHAFDPLQKRLTNCRRGKATAVQWHQQFSGIRQALG